MRQMVRQTRCLARDSRGAAVTEFGFVILPLSIVLLGAIDLGYQSYVRSQLQGVLNDIARTAVVESPDLSEYPGLSLEQWVETAIEERVNAIARNATYEISQTSYFEFSGVGNAEKLVTDLNGNGEYDSGDCFEDANENGVFDTNGGVAGQGGADDVVFYEVTVTMPRLVPVGGLIGVPENYTIRAQAAVRNQPYDDQAIPPTVCGT